MIFAIGNVPDSHKYVKTGFDHFLDWIKGQDSYQLDLETNITATALGRIIRTIQFGEVRDTFNDPGIRFVIVWDDLTEQQRMKLCTILSDHKTKKYIHNADFEYQTLLNYGVVLENVFDTMLAEQIKWAGYVAVDDAKGNSYFSLAATLYRYWGIILDKSYQTAFVHGMPLTEGHIVYAADDITHLDTLAHIQLKFLKEEGLLNVLALENEAVLAFGDISWHGMKVDQAKWLSNLALADPEAEKYLLALNEWLVKEPKFHAYAIQHELIASDDTVMFNKNSPPQKTALALRLFPELEGATLPMLKVYLKSKRSQLSEEKITMLEGMINQDWTQAYMHLANYHREWLIEHGFLRPKGHINLNWGSTAQVLPLFQTIQPRMQSLEEKVMNQFPHPIVTDYQKFKSAKKLVSSYGQQFLDKYVDMDGKVRTHFNQVLSTGRVSSAGPNMQQIPVLSDEEDPILANRYRNAFVPTDEEFTFVDSDYISQELALIAFISNDKLWLDAIALGQDLHSVCAEVVYGKKWKDTAEADCAYYKIIGGVQAKQKCKCKKHKTLRYDVKAVNFGLAYGMSHYKLAGELKITVKEAEQLIEDYFAAFPAIGQTITNLGGFGVQRGYIMTLAPFNRKRWFPEWHKVRDHIPYHLKKIKYNGVLGAIERAAKNQPIQGSSADMMKYALVKIRRYINDNGLRHSHKLVMQVHDQATTEVLKSVAKEWVPIMDKLMCDAAKLIIPRGILKADTSQSNIWTK